jgi:hypothetical protein
MQHHALKKSFLETAHEVLMGTPSPSYRARYASTTVQRQLDFIRPRLVEPINTDNKEQMFDERHWPKAMHGLKYGVIIIREILRGGGDRFMFVPTNANGKFSPHRGYWLSAKDFNLLPMH